jgi:hypothetical protein
MRELLFGTVRFSTSTNSIALAGENPKPTICTPCRLDEIGQIERKWRLSDALWSWSQGKHSGLFTTSTAPADVSPAP